MTNPFDIKRFAKREDGSLLVFFLISIFTLLGIFALSFDMGRRASTQTDMQSYVDNVALAAAGELNGQAGSVTRATTAANSVIVAANELLKAGTGADNLTLSIAEIRFYATLPDHDRPDNFDPATLGDPANANYKYNLPTGNLPTGTAAEIAAADPQARYVGVTLTATDVDWLFGGTVSTEVSSGNFEEGIGALAIAGNAGYTCEIAPVMVCLPRDDADADGDGNTTELLDLNPGTGILLQTVGNGAAWNPGQFGYLDVRNIPDSVVGACAGETPESRFQACLLAQGIEACFEDSGVDIQTGQRGGQEPAGFNLPFGIFGQAMNTLRTDPIYATGPHTVSGQTMNSNCRAVDETMNDTNNTFPFAGATIPFPLEAGLDATDRFGDGTWNQEYYEDVNYTVIDPNTGNAAYDGSDNFGFPAGLTRYEYYLLEILRAENGGSMDGIDVTPFGLTDADFSDAKFGSNANNNDSALASPPAPDALGDYPDMVWDDYWSDTPSGPNGLNPILPDAANVIYTTNNGGQIQSDVGFDNGLPSCIGNGPNNLSASPDPRRRVVVVAGIDCPPGLYTGDEEDVPVAQYYEVFLLGPARDSSGNTETYDGDDDGNSNGNGNPNNNGGGGGNVSPIFELQVEVIRPIGGEGGGSTVTNTAFRELVQLYR